MNSDLLIIGCIFAAVVVLALTVTWIFVSRGSDEKLRNRLNSRSGSAAAAADAPKLGNLLRSVGNAASKPFMPEGDSEKTSALRRKLAQAGIYNPSAVRMVIGAKVMCLFGGVLVGYLLGSSMDLMLFGVSIGGILGYLAPVIWIKTRISANQRALNNGLPDALDLMVVCVEAGLTMDLALQRVGQEFGMAHPAISRELGLAHMETRVGLSRTDALKNIGTRTGNKALQSLATMLVQAERFGTSIASALRVHSDTMRNSRQMAAEECAGKAAVKMSFPLVLCIFPATCIVLAGPMVVKLLESSLFN